MKRSLKEIFQDIRNLCLSQGTYLEKQMKLDELFQEIEDLDHYKENSDIELE